MTGRSPTGRALAVPATPANAVDGPSGFDPSRELLTKVLDYYEGRKPYDFHRLPAFERSNEAFDAWQVIAGEISAFLGRDKKKRRKPRGGRSDVR